MGFFDKFLNAIKLNDDFDDDEDYLDGDDFDDDEDDIEEDEYEKPKTRKRFFSKFSSQEDEFEDEDDDDDFDDKPVKPVKKTASRSSSSRPASLRTESVKRTPPKETAPKYGSASSDYRTAKKQKVTPIRRKSTGSSSGMEVSVIRPSSMEDTREIADTLMNSCTVILNLEGLDVDIAQRVIDFSCGVCYSLEGKLQKVASYIFILTPADVDISGDFQSILTGAFDLSVMQTSY